MTSAEDFDRWYTGWTGTSTADELVQRVLSLPPGLESTSLLGGAGLDEVVPALGLAKGRVLLDLACGRGGYGLEIARRTGCRLVGVDFSAVAIEHARQRSDGDFRVGTLTATGLDTASVDAVLIVDALQFAEPKLDALRECLRVLRPAGRLVVTCWEALDPEDGRIGPRIRGVDLVRQLPEAGFVDVEVTAKPAWEALERQLWEAALAAEALDDPMRSMQQEARHVLPNLDGRRRVLATATAPG